MVKWFQYGIKKCFGFDRVSLKAREIDTISVEGFEDVHEYTNSSVSKLIKGFFTPRLDI